MRGLFSILLSVFLLLPCFNMHGICFAESNEYVIVNTSYSQIFATADFSTPYDFTVAANEKLLLIETISNFYKVEYRIKKENETEVYIGHIPTEFASIYIKPQEQVLEFNGRVLLDSQIYEINSDERLEEIVLTKNHKIFLFEGFDIDSEYNNIKFQFNGKVYTGKILTTNISPDGINKILIIAISMIVSIVSVILIIFGIKKSHKNKKSKIKEINLRRGNE